MVRENENIVIDAIALLLEQCLELNENSVVVKINLSDVLEHGDSGDIDPGVYKNLKLVTNFSFDIEEN